MNNTISWHSMGLSSLYAYFFSSPQGLSQLEAEKRRMGGQGAYKEYQMLLTQTLLGAPAIYLVCIFLFALFCFFNGYTFAGGVGVIASALYSVVFVREARSRVNWAVMLGNLNREKVLVYRDGQPKHHLPEDLVLGDVIVLEPHTVLPVTVRIIEGNQLITTAPHQREPQEKVATNFSKEETVVTKLFSTQLKVKEQDPENVILAGSCILQGQGTGIIIEIPDENKTEWMVQQFHIEPLFNLKNMALFPFGLAAFTAIALFFIVSFVLDDKSHNVWATLLASLGFLVLLFPATAILLQVHQANLQVHDLLRKQIVLRNTEVFNKLLHTSLVVAEAQYLFQDDMTQMTDLISQGLKLVLFTQQSSEWLKAQLAQHGILNIAIIDGEQFRHQSDRQIEEQIQKGAFFAHLTANDQKRLFQTLKAKDTSFIMIGERLADEEVMPRELRVLFAQQAESSLIRNATDILLFSSNIKDFLFTLLVLQKQKNKLDQNEALLRTTHYFCAAGVILAFLIGGGVGELVAFSLLILLGLWNTFSV